MTSITHVGEAAQYRLHIVAHIIDFSLTRKLFDTIIKSYLVKYSVLLSCDAVSNFKEGLQCLEKWHPWRYQLF